MLSMSVYRNRARLDTIKSVSKSVQNDLVKFHEFCESVYYFPFF